MSNRSAGSAPVRNFNSSSGVSDSRAFQPEPTKPTDKPTVESSTDKQADTEEHSQSVGEGSDP